MGTTREKMEFFDVLNEMRKIKYFSWRIREGYDDHYYLPIDLWSSIKRSYSTGEI